MIKKELRRNQLKKVNAGATAIEYGLVAAGISVAIIAALSGKLPTGTTL